MTDRARTVELGVAVLALVAFVLYAVGWSFLGTFYGEFGVDPEEVGRSWEWVVARTAVVAVPPLGLVVVGGVLVGGRRLVAGWVQRAPDRVDEAARFAAVSTTALAAALAGMVLVAGLGSSAIWLSAVVLVPALFLLGVALGSRRPALALVAGGFATAGLLVTSAAVADADARLVQAGLPVSFRPFDFLPTVLEVPQVRVVGPGHVLDGSCVALLGVGPDATAVLYAPVPGAPADEVWRVSLGEVDLVRFGNGVCDPIAGYDVDDQWPADRPSTAAP